MTPSEKSKDQYKVPMVSYMRPPDLLRPAKLPDGYNSGEV